MARAPKEGDKGTDADTSRLASNVEEKEADEPSAEPAIVTESNGLKLHAKFPLAVKAQPPKAVVKPEVVNIKPFPRYHRNC